MKRTFIYTIIIIVLCLGLPIYIVRALPTRPAYNQSWIYNVEDGVVVQTDAYILHMPESWKNTFTAEITPSEEAYGGKSTDHYKIREDNYRLTVIYRDDDYESEIGSVDMYSYSQDAFLIENDWDPIGRLRIEDPDSYSSKDRWDVYLLFEYPVIDQALTAGQQAHIKAMQSELLDALRDMSFPESRTTGYDISLSSTLEDRTWNSWGDIYKQREAEERARKRAQEYADKARTRYVPVTDLHSCTEDGCHTLVPVSISYCDRHVCQAKGGCNSRRRPGSEYCGDHTCMISNCYREVTQFTDHCPAHQTDADRKALERRSHRDGTCRYCGVAVEKGADYCSKHTCTESGCKNFKDYDGLCYYHIHKMIWRAAPNSDDSATACAVGRCHRDKVAGSDYCSLHTCSVSGCYSMVVSKGLCYKHRHGSSSPGYHDDYYADDPEAYYEDNKDLYDSFDEAMVDWEDEYGDDY